MSVPTPDLAKFNDQGFLLLRGLVSEQQVDELRALIDPLLQDFTRHLGRRARDVGALDQDVIGTRQPEIDRPSSIDPAIRESAAFRTLQDVAATLLGAPAKYTFDHVICKMPRSDTPTAWHQDQGYLGPNVRLESVNFWLPFVDTDKNNGTLCYVPGSHRQPLLPHGPVAEGHPHVRSIGEKITEFEAPALKLGDVCVHHPMIIHGAGPNKTDAPRVAWAVHFSRDGRAGYLRPQNLMGTLGRALRRLRPVRQTP